MPAPHAPPPGAVPSMDGFDEQSLQSMMGGGGKPGGAPGSLPGSSPTGQQKPPRPIGTPTEEAKTIGADVAQGLIDFLPPIIRNIIQPKSSDTPEEAAKKKQIFQNYQQLNAEQQRVAQEELQKANLRKQKEQEEDMRKKQEAQQKADSGALAMPSGKRSGEQAVQKLQDDKKKMTSAG